MKGFFEKEKTILPYKSEKGVHSCASCGLYKQVSSPRMKPYGKFKKEIMVIGESPGATEDTEGKPWQGKMGKVLQHKCKRLGIDLFEDCISVNAVNCRAVDEKGNNRPPTEYEIACCRQKIFDAIKQYKPKIIILQGVAALSSLIGHKWRKTLGGITKWQGWTIPDREYNAWVCPTFHPSFVARQEDQNEIEVIWANDLKRAFSLINTPLPIFKNEEDCIEISEDIEAVVSQLNNVPEGIFMAFDIETTGLKPYNKDIHKIVSISFCNNMNKAYAIPFPEKKKHLRLLKQLLENPKIGKIAANMKFEDNWLNVMCGINPHPWRFDTMQAAHVLNNCPGITGLKFQAYVRFGVLGYDEEIEPFLKSPDSNTPNRIMELVKDKDAFRKLLIYNGIDSLLEYRLAILQMKELKIHI